MICRINGTTTETHLALELFFRTDGVYEYTGTVQNLKMSALCKMGQISNDTYYLRA